LLRSKASFQPFTKGEGLKKEKIDHSTIKVLSFGEDLGEANKMTLLQAFETSNNIEE
jgi:hypothetical protein